MNEIHLNIRRPAWMELDGFEKAGQATVSEFRRSIVAKKCLASQKIENLCIQHPMQIVPIGKLMLWRRGIDGMWASW